MNREILLGYLMDALDDAEVGGVERELIRDPLLREECSRLRSELQPLAVASREEYLPPLGLAERTCARIWASVDHSNEKFVPAVTFNRVRMLDAVLADSFNDNDTSPVPRPQVAARSVGAARPQVAARSVELPAAESKLASKPSGSGRRLTDLVASIAVGVLIAVIAFPVINFAKQQAETMIRQSRMKEFGQSAGLYALIDGKSDDGEMTGGINLAASAWREVNQDRLQLLHVAGNSPLATGSLLGSPLFKTVSDHAPLLGEQQGQMVFLGQEPAAMFGGFYDSMPPDVEKAIPVSNGSLVQPAYGQNILFQDGRVFFRVLPIFPPPTQTDEF